MIRQVSEAMTATYATSIVRRTFRKIGPMNDSTALFATALLCVSILQYARCIYRDPTRYFERIQLLRVDMFESNVCFLRIVTGFSCFLV